MIELAKALNEALKETSEAKEYFALKKAISENEKLQDLLSTIQKYQLLMQEALKSNQIDEYKSIKKTLEELKNEFINHPLISNYISSKQELYDVLNQVVEILSVD